MTVIQVLCAHLVHASAVSITTSVLQSLHVSFVAFQAISCRVPPSGSSTSSMSRLSGAVLLVLCSTASAYKIKPTPLMQAYACTAELTGARVPTTKMSFSLASTYITEMAQDAMRVVAAMDAIDAMRADAARVVAAMERTDAAMGVVEAMEQIDAAAKVATAMDAIDAAWARFEVDVQMEAA